MRLQVVLPDGSSETIPATAAPEQGDTMVWTHRDTDVTAEYRVSEVRNMSDAVVVRLTEDD